MSTKINGENKFQEETSFSQDATWRSDKKSKISQLVLIMVARWRFGIDNGWQRNTRQKNNAIPMKVKLETMLSDLNSA